MKWKFSRIMLGIAAFGIMVSVNAEVSNIITFENDTNHDLVLRLNDFDCLLQSPGNIDLPANAIQSYLFTTCDTDYGIARYKIYNATFNDKFEGMIQIALFESDNPNVGIVANAVQLKWNDHFFVKLTNNNLAVQRLTVKLGPVQDIQY